MNGIINVYKEKGYTSHDVVAKLRSIFHQKKIGHTGTLDPDAEGVLPVCLGTATKVCSFLTDKDKEYEAVLLLGKDTDTQDIGGNIVNEADVVCTKEEAICAIRSFIGAYGQIPPMYSALKVNGKKLCDLAREGIEVERKPRMVQIYEIEIQWVELPRIKMRVHCSKGTYIRTLCYDIGKKLGCGGCMEQLVRTRTGNFTLDESVKLMQIQTLTMENRIAEFLQPVDQVFFNYPKAKVTLEFQKMLQNGNRLPVQAFLFACDTEVDRNRCQPVRVYLEEEFFGIYRFEPKQGDYKPMKIFGQGILGR